ncbi:unnamed protein product [Nippostrongylus brasiliensis]|uniref:Oxidored_FMN domain-containing protein n=1 Tax=Nippostrongylus brasiliensis TaxID=27835 RepID=A0A158QX61_NIPBR|nr:unnamed protein product [Nippostrongylus brasiliensis]
MGLQMSPTSGSGAVAQRLKQGICTAALTEILSTWDGKNLQERGIPTQALVNVYDKWGHGGYGMILTGNIQVSPAGRQTPLAVNAHPFSVSDIQLKGNPPLQLYGTPIALTEEQIKTEVVDRFVFAAKYAHKHGFDGVQLHSAHGYLLSSFLSPTTNNRTDKYGGSVENRFRVVREVYEAIRKEIPPTTGFIVGIKVNSVEFQDKGLGVEDAKAIGAMIEACGFDFVELSGGTLEKLAFAHLRESTKRREAFFLEFAQQVRECCGLFFQFSPYELGGFRTAPAMVLAVRDGSTDGIGLGRPATAEPDEVRHFKEAVNEYFKGAAELAARNEPVYKPMKYKNVVS